MASYTRKVGPKADVNELIYVIALQQTAPIGGARIESKTISHLDVLRYLKSRHGVAITEDQAKDIVLTLGGPMPTPEQRLELAHELREEHLKRLHQSHRDQWVNNDKYVEESMRAKNGSSRANSSQMFADMLGEDSEVDDTKALITELVNPKIFYLDLVQITSLLMIPTILSLSKSWDQKGDTLEENADENKTETPGQFDDKPQFDESSEVSAREILGVAVQSMQSLVARKANHSDRALEINHDLIRNLLLQKNELEWANNEDLIDEMVSAAKRISPAETAILDEETLVRCMTEDIQAWPVGCEDSVTTVLQDIQNVPSQEETRLTKEDIPIDNGPNVVTNIPDQVAESPQEADVMESQVLNSSIVSVMTNTYYKSELWAPIEIQNGAKLTTIDSVVDSYASFAVFVVLWLFYLTQSYVFSSFLVSSDVYNTNNCDEFSFSCALLITIGQWLLLASLLSSAGILILLPMSQGNHPRKRSTKSQLVSFSSAVSTVMILYIGANVIREEDLSGDSGVPTLGSSEGSRAIEVSLVFGTGICVFYLVNLLLSVINDRRSKPLGGLAKTVLTTSDMRGSSKSKQAGRHKINGVLRNAIQMHRMDMPIGNSKKESGSTKRRMIEGVFQNFVNHGEKAHEYSIGWAFRAVSTGYLFNSEGVWLPSRMWIFQVGQILAAVVLAIVLFKAIDSFAENADETDLPPDLPSWIYEISPTGVQVRSAMIPAAIIATAVCCLIILLYIPSTVNTIVKFRCGMITSLGSPLFENARQSPDMAYMNTANAVYAMVAAAGLFFVLVSLLLFLFIWPFSRDIMLVLCGWGLGLGITIGLKVLLTLFCRKRFFRSFYRISEGGSNMASLALECWYIGIGGGILLGRLTQFLLAAAFWIGRIDVPFLADNVGLLGYKFDYVPMFYIQDILVHEAHRHPYIERLGAMYLMRLAHKDFVSKANNAWRQLFLLSLMPWLMRYRVHGKNRVEDSVSDQQNEAKFSNDEDVTIENLSNEFLNSASIGQTTMIHAAQGIYETVNEIGAETVGMVKDAVAAI